MSDVVENVHKVGAIRELSEGACNRFVVHPKDQRHSSPFILLVEDWIEPQVAGFDMHPHRGFETVTLVLKGAMRHQDHLGASGVLRGGDVQWTRAGRGIFHGGHPEGSERLHALQLWLNLPAAMKSAAPGTLEQHLADTLLDEADGVQVIVHAGAYNGRAQPHCSLWPLTLVEAKLQANRSITLDARPEDRAFLYVLEGEVSIDGVRTVAQGEVAWFRFGDSRLAQGVRLHAALNAQVVYYASPPIDEPIAMHGPFVMNTEEEIRQAYADLKSNKLLEHSD